MIVLRVIVALCFTLQALAQPKPSENRTVWRPRVNPNFLNGHENQIVYVPGPDGIWQPAVYLYRHWENGEWVYEVRLLEPADLGDFQAPGLPIAPPTPNPSAGAESGPGKDAANPGSTFSMTGGLNAGAEAAAATAILRGIYNNIVMTPERETEMRRASEQLRSADRALQKSQAELDASIKKQGLAGVLARKTIETTLSQPPPQSLPFPPPANDYKSFSYATHDPAFLEQAEPIQMRLARAPVSAQVDKDVRALGKASLEAASRSWAANDHELAGTQLKVATLAADLLVGIDPYVGTIRSGYELLLGKNMVTGEELSSWQRAISGTVFVASLVSLGAASSLAQSIRATVGILKEMHPSVLQKGLQALAQTKNLTSGLQKLRWSEAKIEQFAKFERHILGGEIKSFDEALFAFNNWSQEAKASYRAVMKDLALSDEELTKAAQHFAVEKDVLSARRATAIGFYNNQAQFQGNSSKIAKHLSGIDFRQEVVLENIPKGKQVYAWRHWEKADVGNYVSETITHPTLLGTGDLVIGRDGQVYAKELRKYVVEREVTALSSTANEIADTFSVPKDLNPPFSGWDRYSIKGTEPVPGLQWGPGGGKQLFLDSSVLKEIPYP